MKILLLNQTFHPDVMATAQYLTQVACALAERGHAVTVVTSRRAYDEPATQFPAKETWRGIRIFRVASTAFGKGGKWRRAVDFASFTVSCCARLASLPKQDVVVALTSPPLISFIGAWLARLRGSRFVYWVMDFNPDEAIAAGWLRSGSIAARLLERMSRFSLLRAHKVIALDRFMRDRIVAKGIPVEKVSILPPWAHDDQVRFDAAGRERFRTQHGLRDKFVVMYSGNHSPIHPLDTLLEAARRMAGERDMVFCFIGGGSEFQRVKQMATDYGLRSTTRGNIQHRTSNIEHRSGNQKATDHGTTDHGLRTTDYGLTETSNIEHRTLNIERRLPNVLCLPYQPLDQLSASLSAADAHVVVMGNPFVGLVHPCKIYNMLGVGGPVLYVGPQPSHVSEILDSTADGYPTVCARHGEVELLVQGIQRLHQQSNSAQRPVPTPVCSHFSKDKLLPRLIAELESD